MKEFRSIDIDAGELVRSLGRLAELRVHARLVEGKDIGRPLSQNEVRAVWSNSKGLNANLPSVLLSTESVLANFLPRMLALPGVVTPVTSLMRAWLIEDFRSSNIYGERPLSNVAALGFVGLIMGELKTTVGSDTDLRLMGMDSVRRTLSFVCAQAVIKGWRNKSLAIIVGRWLEASALTANEANVAAQVQIANVCGFLQVLSDLGEDEEFSPQTLAHRIQSWVEEQNGLNQGDLLQCSPPQVAHALMGVSSREKRYDAIMEVLNQSKSAGGLSPLEHGFLISLIEPGSFEFLEMAKRADPSSGSVATAYCVCAAILGKEATLSKFSGFGWTVLNHALRFGVDMAMDISIAELRILHNTRRSAPILFRTRSPWLVDVELAPMVTGSFGNVARRRASSQRAEEESGADQRDESLRESLATALRALEDAYDVLQRKKPRQNSKISKQRQQSR